MEEQPTFAGIGPIQSCYIIAKSDLQPDGMTPKEGKAWTKLDTVQTKIAIDAQPPSRGFKQSFEMSFEIERLTNRAIRSKVEYSAENVQDCERLLRSWKPHLIARKKLLRAALRLSRAVLSWIKEQDQSIDRTMAIMDVEYHINRLRLLLGKKILVAWTVDPDTDKPYVIYSRLHRHKVIGVAINAKYTFPHKEQI